VAGLVLPLLGCLLGVWAGATWLRGWRARLWFVPKAVLLCLLPVLGMGVFLWQSLEDSPLPIEASQVTSEEKRRLVSLVRSKSPRSLEEGQTHTLSLTEHDINVLLSWGLSIGWPDGKATVSLAQDSASLSVSAAVPVHGERRHLNLTLTGNAGIDDGVVRLTVDRCLLGRREVPAWLLDSLPGMVTAMVDRDSRAQPFLKATKEIAVRPGSIDVTYSRVHLPPDFREDLFGSRAVNEGVLASARAQVDNLFAVVGRTVPMRPSFGTCMETVFSLARDRSVERDPVVENQAAILALGVLLGHPRIEEFLGSVGVDSQDGATRQALSRVTIRQRADWTKHFCVSASIVIFSNVAVSDAAGLLKEELDAGRGGSGFSFGDLLADRSGATFARCATGSEAAARAMQDRLTQGFRVEEFFPPAEDLPEGIPDAQLQSQYGGVGGEGYRRVVEEIERRIAACAAYR
jgi:hypothetical protein